MPDTHDPLTRLQKQPESKSNDTVTSLAYRIAVACGNDVPADEGLGAGRTHHGTFSGLHSYERGADMGPTNVAISETAPKHRDLIEEIS